jgi:uncharacterized GH25 family protein
MRTTLVLAALLVALSSGAQAHDFWIEPSSFTPRPGEVVTLRLLVGERLAGETLPRSDAMITSFVMAGPDGTQPVRGRDGLDPAGIVTPTKPGLHVVGYRSRPSSVELEPGKFASYLETEGLQKIASLRAARGETDKPAKERFSRCAKALLAVGPSAATGKDATLDLTLELVAEKSPAALLPGDALPLRLTYDGQPIAGVLVSALSGTSPSANVAARTDDAGRVSLPLTVAGPWLVKAVHMIPLPPGDDAQWESFWASLTFGVSTREAAASQ